MKHGIHFSALELRAYDDARLAAVIRDSERGSSTRRLACAEMTRRLEQRNRWLSGEQIRAAELGNGAIFGRA